jgi:hypothetical protein
MILAELEVFHSRRIAPTRRVALGATRLPTDPAPGFGGLLLGGLVAARIEEVDPDLHADLTRLINELEEGRRIPQPRLRYRFQADTHGLAKSKHRLIGRGESIDYDIDDHDAAEPQILAAVYAAGRLAPSSRRGVMEAIRRGMRWRGPIGPQLVSHLSGVAGARTWSADAFADPTGWALGVLGLANGAGGDRTAIQRRFRTLLREAHPDHGADTEGAAQRILDLTEARRILLRT